MVDMLRLLPPTLQVHLAFPAVLERLALPAFDLCKVIEPFVQQLPSLPRCACPLCACINSLHGTCCVAAQCGLGRHDRAYECAKQPCTCAVLLRPCRDLKRHMLSVEERCLESLCWKQGSSLYAALVASVGAPNDVSGSCGGSHAPPAAAAPAGQADQAQHSTSPASSRSIGDGSGSDLPPSRGLTARKRGAEEMEAPVNSGLDADMADGPEAAGQLDEAREEGRQAQRQRRAQEPERGGLDAYGRLPLSLGSQAPLVAPTGSAQQQASAAEGAGQPRGDRRARSAVSRPAWCLQPNFTHGVLGAPSLVCVIETVSCLPALPDRLASFCASCSSWLPSAWLTCCLAWTPSLATRSCCWRR